MDAPLVHVGYPYWLNHGGKPNSQNPIYSTHFHPDGTRLVTGSDVTAKIWATKSLEKDGELDESQPKLLCTLSMHVGAVTVVRWSPDGEWLATAGDDKILYLWRLAAAGESSIVPFGSKKKGRNVENWRYKSGLTGHTADIQDLGWSPCGRFIASCSVDRTVIIWDTDYEHVEKVRTLTAHKNWVKGVAWDPTGRFLASFSTDGVLIIWSTEDWKVVKEVRKPFSEKSFETNLVGSRSTRQMFFSRMDWSPDGSCLIVCQGFHQKSSVFTSVLFERDQWKEKSVFCGHHKPTTVVRFSPLWFQDTQDRNDNGKNTFLFTMGSVDTGLTLWFLNRQKPLFYFRHFFSMPVLDISWSPDGYSFVACSSAGNVAYFKLNPQVLKQLHSGARVCEESDSRAAWGSLYGSLEFPADACTRARNKKRPRLSSSTSTPSIHKPAVVSKSKKRRITPSTDSSARDESASSKTAHPHKRPRLSLKGPKEVEVRYVEREKSPEFSVPTKSRGSSVSTCKIAPNFCLKIAIGSRDGRSGIQEIFSLINFYEGDRHCWENEVMGRITCRACASASGLVVCGTGCGNVYIYRANSGRLVLSAMQLQRGTPLLGLAVAPSDHVACLWKSGDIKVWHIDRLDPNNSSVTMTCSTQPLFTGKVSGKRTKFSSLNVSESGAPIITMASGFSYLYSPGLDEWVRVQDDYTWASEFNHGGRGTVRVARSNGVLRDLEKPVKRHTVRDLAKIGPEKKARHSTTHLEKQMVAALLACSAAEYEDACRMYVDHLVKISKSLDRSALARLRDFCMSLMGPRGEDAGKILKIDKHEFLQSILPSLRRTHTRQLECDITSLLGLPSPSPPAASPIPKPRSLPSSAPASGSAADDPVTNGPTSRARQQTSHAASTSLETSPSPSIETNIPVVNVVSIPIPAVPSSAVRSPAPPSLPQPSPVP